ncbi:hypothetical protein IQ06DRAFT_350645 [Phaeosphaeriaceae sp. SRC1lsM3a]|nr:hypothetical protein IQ06DRAFT_350645 [Stagonospora sp. SRC1lsM3a]
MRAAIFVTLLMAGLGMTAPAPEIDLPPTQTITAEPLEARAKVTKWGWSLIVETPEPSAGELVARDPLTKWGWGLIVEVPEPTGTASA